MSGPSGVTGTKVSFGGSITAGWERWVQGESRGAGLGNSGVSPSLAARPPFPLQGGTNNTSSVRPSFPNKALGHLEPLRIFYRMGAGQVPPEKELSCLGSLHRKLQGARSQWLSLEPQSLRRKSWALMIFWGSSPSSTLTAAGSRTLLGRSFLICRMGMVIMREEGAEPGLWSVTGSILPLLAEEVSGEDQGLARPQLCLTPRP